jgi:hypothetical protein
MDTCSICLEEIKDKHIIKKLSCNHTIHFLCFKKMVYHNNNFYINCPLCRVMNHNVDKPFKDDDKKNISIMCHSGVGKVRCICNNKNNTRCKNKPVLMNYGKCYSHSKNILKKEHYKLYSDYLYYIIGSNYNWLSIIYLLDVGKKIIIKFLNENNQVSDILQYYYRYLNDKNNGNKSMFYMNGIYKYYYLEEIPRNWINYCVNKNVII